MSTPSLRGSAPPDRPVPLPRATNGRLRAAHSRTTAATWQADWVQHSGGVQPGLQPFGKEWFTQTAGVRLTMRALRRGFGCKHAGKVPAQVLQRLMRHSDIKITMDYYANVDQAAEDHGVGDVGDLQLIEAQHAYLGGDRLRDALERIATRLESVRLTRAERDAILTLIERTERTFEDDVPEKQAKAIEVLAKFLEVKNEDPENS